MDEKRPARKPIPAPIERGHLEITVRGKKHTPRSHPTVDLVFVIDTTGSMSDKIQGVLATVNDFLESFSALELDHRVAIMAFGDLSIPGDHIVCSPFLTQLAALQKVLLKIPRFDGGGNEGESSLEALEAARQLAFRPASVKVLVLITDEPALRHRHDARAVTERLKRSEFLTYVISPPIDYFQEMARSTGATWLQVTSAADFGALLAMLQELARRMSALVQDVHEIASGSVPEYLRLHPPAGQ